MPQIGPLEIVVVAMIALIVFGPEKLPGIARSIGRAMNELRRMASEVKDEFSADLEVEDEQTAATDELPTEPPLDGPIEQPAERGESGE